LYYLDQKISPVYKQLLLHYNDLLFHSQTHKDHLSIVIITKLLIEIFVFILRLLLLHELFRQKLRTLFTTRSKWIHYTQDHSLSLLSIYLSCSFLLSYFIFFLLPSHTFISNMVDQNGRISASLNAKLIESEQSEHWDQIYK
jgi:uncharacterized protein involved in cysteine biosynthesis